MNMTRWVSGVVVAGLLAFAGCGKSGKAAGEQPTAAMDFAKFREAFPTPTPEQQQAVAKVFQGIRYRLYPDAIAALEQLSGDASLTDAQKKAVNNLTEGLKRMTANAPAPPQ